jgi:hypothetical protein
MFVAPATLTLLFRLAATAGAGLVAMMAFVVLTVDRLNARVAELEARLAAHEPRAATVLRPPCQRTSSSTGRTDPQSEELPCPETCSGSFLRRGKIVGSAPTS